MTILYIIIAIVVAIALFIAFVYNNLIKLRNLADEAWSNVDVFLTKRHELIPQLVATVKGYSDHEKSVLEKLTLLRSQAIAASTPGSQLAVEDQLTKVLADLKVNIERYPNLKANENFLKLQKQLVDMETEIERSRRYFNGCVRNLNTAIETFPNNIIANMFNFKRKNFYEVEDASHRKAPSAVIAITFLLAFSLTGCFSSSTSIITSATKSAIMAFASPTDKNIKSFQKNYLKAQEEIARLEANSVENTDRYIRLNNRNADITALGKALCRFGNPGDTYTLTGNTESFTFQIPDFTELLNEAAEGASMAFEARGDKVMNNPTASSAQLEQAWKNYQNAGVDYKAEQAKQRFFSQLMVEGERGFNQDLTSSQYESALSSFAKAADYGVPGASQRYEELMSALSMTLVVNIPSISNSRLDRLQRRMPSYVRVTVDPDMRRSLQYMRGDLALIIDVVKQRGSYRDNDSHHQGTELELLLIDLRTGRNGSVVMGWPIKVNYPRADTRNYNRAARQAEIDAFEQAIFTHGYDIERAVKNNVRVMPRRSNGSWRY